MTRLAYFDCPAGAAGDMILGALVDAGVPFEALREGLRGLPVDGYSVECRQVMKGAFRATKVDVRVAGVAGPDRRGDTHSHEGARRSDAHGPDHHAHPHRGLSDVLAIIEPSPLPAPVKATAARIFTRLAEAEGRAHGVAPEAVHFHDVGAVDAIVDITGACLGLHLLGVDAVHCSALPVGGGLVEGPHGRIPAPAPGTLELLRGVPVVDNGIHRELLTPTGAAILTTVATGFGSLPAMTPTAVGYGAGAMELDIPNVLRVLVGEAETARAVDTLRQVETTIDDMSPQLYEPLIERLLGAGALDVYLTPVLMKKSRPGIVLTALCIPDLAPVLARILFEESTTIGVRWTAYERQRLPRETATLATRYGPVPFKLSRLEGRVVTATPEFDAVRRLARDKGVPVREVLDEARAEGRRLLGR